MSYPYQTKRQDKSSEYEDIVRKKFSGKNAEKIIKSFRRAKSIRGAEQIFTKKDWKKIKNIGKGRNPYGKR